MSSGAASQPATVVLYSSQERPACRAVVMVARSLGLRLRMRTGRTPPCDGSRRSRWPAASLTVPTLDDDGFVLTDSHAILGYLVDQYAYTDILYPNNPKRRALVNKRLLFDVTTFGYRFMEYYFPVAYNGCPFDTRSFQRLQEAYYLLNDMLVDEFWVAGKHITIADYSMAASASTALVCGFDLNHYPNVINWLQRTARTIEGFEEINKAGIFEFKHMLEKAVYSQSFRNSTFNNRNY